MSAREIHLIAFLQNAGLHHAAWRHPDVDPVAHLRLDFFLELARTAERGRFDAVFFADSPSAGPWTGEHATKPSEKIDPALLLASIAVVTDRIGLIATGSTTFDEPYNVARRFASLDLISGGRAGWNMVTSMLAEAARNFGYDQLPGNDFRYDRGREFLDVVLGLWGEWRSDAIRADQQSGVYAELAGIRPVRHRGEHFSVAGPLNVPPSPQGRPIIVQAGASEPGMELAAAFADVVFAAHDDLSTAQRFYAKLKNRARALGRDPDHVVVLPGLVPIVAETEARAREKSEELDALLNLDDALATFSEQTTIPVDQIDLDAPVPAHVRDPRDYDGNRSRYQMTLDTARREKLTVREVLQRVAGTMVHQKAVGTPEQVADLIELWVDSKAADGFNIMPAAFPGGLNDFVDLVVPVLQDRGRFRHEYTGATLRENLGLAMPQQTR